MNSFKKSRLYYMNYVCERGGFSSISSFFNFDCFFIYFECFTNKSRILLKESIMLLADFDYEL